MQFVAITDKIWTVDNFLTKKECDDLIQLSEKKGYEIATVNTGKGAEIVESIRNNDRSMHLDYDLAAELWDKSKAFIPSKFGDCTAVGLNELFRFYRYNKGHKFKGHYDGIYRRSAIEFSALTFMVYLNDDFEGGQTSFRDLIIEPAKGKLLMFVHRVYHAGEEVTEGIKYVLRTDVMYRFDEEDDDDY